MPIMQPAQPKYDGTMVMMGQLKTHQIAVGTEAFTYVCMPEGPIAYISPGHFFFTLLMRLPVSSKDFPVPQYKFL